jgi:hypothetical protein
MCHNADVQVDGLVRVHELEENSALKQRRQVQHNNYHDLNYGYGSSECCRIFPHAHSFLIVQELDKLQRIQAAERSMLEEVCVEAYLLLMPFDGHLSDGLLLFVL